jgi:hypothetical protein
MCKQKAKKKGVISYHKRLWEDQQRVGFQSMLSEFPTNKCHCYKMTKMCHLFHRNILFCLYYLVLLEVLFPMNKCIWYFGLHNTISCVKHMNFCFRFDDEN